MDKTSNNILVLGAGALQVPLIEKIKAKGYNPIVVSLVEDEPGMVIAKDKIVADFCDQELMLEYAKHYNVCGIITDQTDIPVRTVAYVSERLGFPGIGYETACLFTDKYKMRARCEELGIKTIRHRLVNSLDEAKSFFRELGNDAILKPINNQGSKGIYKVASEAELEAKYNDSIKYSRNEPILIEEYIVGEEIVIEAMVHNHEVTNLICGDTHYFDIPDAFSARERIFPSKKSLDIVNKAYEQNIQIIEGFGLKQGITHAEYIIKENDVYLLEIAARGGGVYISSDIIPLMTSVDTLEFLIDITTGKLNCTPIVKNCNKVVCYRAFFLPQGEVVNVDGVNEVTQLPYIHHHNLYAIKKGKNIGPNSDKTSRFFMVIEADDYNMMEDRISTIQSILNIDVRTVNNTIKHIIWN